MATLFNLFRNCQTVSKAAAPSDVAAGSAKCPDTCHLSPELVYDAREALVNFGFYLHIPTG